MNGKAGETDTTSSAINSIGSHDGSASSPKTSIDRQQLFSRFEAFNFDDDHTFQTGLAKITSQASSEKGREQAVELLKIKLFYYSKYVEPLDMAAYMKWRTCMADDGCGRSDGCCDHQALQSNHHDRHSHPACDAQGEAKDKECEDLHRAQCEDAEAGADCQPHDGADCQSHDGADCQPHDDAQSEGGQTCSGQFSQPPEYSVTTVVVDSTTTTAASVTEYPGCKERNQGGTGVKPTGSGITCTDVDLNQDKTQSGHVTETAARRDTGHSGNVTETEARMDAGQSHSGHVTETRARMDGGQGHSAVCGSEGAGERLVGEVGGPELSFAEVAELIRCGRAIPGLAQVEVTSTNMAPSPSQLHRPRKPWEE